MAAVAAGSRVRGRHNEVALAACPMCGQPLLDHDAVERVEHFQEEADRQTQAVIRVEAGKLAKQIARKENEAAERKIAGLTSQVESQKRAHDTALTRQKTAHAAELRDLRAKTKAEAATEAEKAATAKVQLELRKKDRLITSLRDENETQQRRIEHLTADERGEMNEEELVSRLHVAFPEDKIERLGRGRAGSDILHEVRFPVDGKTQVAGLIVYECKDTLQWGESFVTQAKKARVTHHTPHVVIVSRAFPRGQKELCVRHEIPIVSPTRLVELARILREMVIELHRAELTGEGRAAKTAELYDYLAGEDFRNDFDRISEDSATLNDLLAKERTAHERSWSARQQLYNELGSKSAAIDGRLRAIIERSNGRKNKVVRLAGT